MSITVEVELLSGKKASVEAGLATAWPKDVQQVHASMHTFVAILGDGSVVSQDTTNPSPRTATKASLDLLHLREMFAVVATVELFRTS